ncbi:Oligopeptide ABC transporter periplasmic oligopeptide-binding protein OppA [Bacillus mycoides]|nr:Oligopeptide ABC transporter periplasmic oligopeptide-binding protein OppA [Bacillus mycoides]
MIPLGTLDSFLFIIFLHQNPPLYHTGLAYVQKEYLKGIEKHQFGGVYNYKNAYIIKK